MRCRNRCHLRWFTCDNGKMSKSKDFTKHEASGSARLVDLCAADRGRVAALVDELGRHAERARAAEARSAQLESQAREEEDKRKQLEVKQSCETAELLKQLADGKQSTVELRAKLDGATHGLAETQTQLEAESRAAAENLRLAKQAEHKYAELRRNAAKVAELNRELESRLAALESSSTVQRHASTQTEPPKQVVAPGTLVRARTRNTSREIAVLSELFFTTAPSPPELDDLFFLPSETIVDDNLALFNSQQQLK